MHGRKGSGHELKSDDDDDANERINKHYAYPPNEPMVRCKLPPIYEEIRALLVKYDPIPPHVLNQYNLATNAYKEVERCHLARVKNLQCRIATKELQSSALGLQKHPVLIFYDEEPTRPHHTVWVMHLVRDSATLKARVEFDVKLWKKFASPSWKVSNRVFNLGSTTLLDVAKWAVRYERIHPEYTELVNNCRKFMTLLADYIHVEWDDQLMLEKKWYCLSEVVGAKKKSICMQGLLSDDSDNDDSNTVSADV
jgi:hypothetical protein